MGPLITYASLVFQLSLSIKAQFPVQGQYAFPQMSGMQGPVPSMPMHMSMPMPGAMSMPGAMPMGPRPPMTLNAPFQLPQPKLPVVVMPYSKASERKHRRRRRNKKKYKDSCSSSSSESSSSSREYLRSKKHRKHVMKQKRQVLTPVISYVTRNGDVIYQKKIKKEKAGDWLDLRTSKSSKVEEGSKDVESQEMTVRDLKRKFYLKKKHNHRK